MYKLLTKAIKYAIVIGNMLKDIIPKNKTYSFLYTIVATIIAVSHLFSLDKTTALNVGDFSDIWTGLLIISIVVTIFSLPYAIGLSASKSLLNVSRLCGLFIPISGPPRKAETCNADLCLKKKKNKQIEMNPK